MTKMKATDKFNENDDNWYLASLVVQVKPEKLNDVRQILLAEGGTEIHGENPAEGKLVVVMESNNQPELVERMESVKEIQGVIAVSLIYSYQDEQ